MRTPGILYGASHTYEHGAGTIRAVARKLGVHRREVRRALANAMPPDRKRPQREHTKLAPAIPFIDAILEADRHAPRKQRHTAHRIWTRLQQEKPEIVVGAAVIERLEVAVDHPLGPCLEGVDGGVTIGNRHRRAVVSLLSLKGQLAFALFDLIANLQTRGDHHFVQMMPKLLIERHI
jgi:hypothetical protein